MSSLTLSEARRLFAKLAPAGDPSAPPARHVRIEHSVIPFELPKGDGTGFACPWLTLAVDMATGEILASEIHFEEPCQGTVARCVGRLLPGRAAEGQKWMTWHDLEVLLLRRAIEEDAKTARPANDDLPF